MMSIDRERLRERVAALAAQGVHLGTSSWKYEGWLGQLYTRRPLPIPGQSGQDPIRTRLLG